MRNKVCLGYKCALPSPASRNHSANSCIQGHFSAISRAESGYKAQTEEQAKRPWGTQEVLHLVMGGDNYKERGASWRRWHLRCTWAAASGKGRRARQEAGGLQWSPHLCPRQTTPRPFEIWNMRWGRCRRFFRRTLDPGAGGRPPCLYGKGNGAQRGKAICPSHTANSAGAGPGWGAQGGVRGVWREGEHPDFMSRCPRHTAFSVKLGIKRQIERNCWSLSRV